MRGFCGLLTINYFSSGLQRVTGSHGVGNPHSGYVWTVSVNLASGNSKKVLK